jgi:putative endonuclease
MADGQKKSWFVYVILTERNALYTGITTDVERRFQQHMEVYCGVEKSKGAKFFRSQKPLHICYQKVFADRSSASQWEYQLKKMPRKKKLEWIYSDSELMEAKPHHH